MSAGIPTTSERVREVRIGVAPSRTAAAVELALLVGGVLAIMWIAPLTPWREPLSQAITWALVLLLLVCHLRDRPSLREIGLRLDNFVPVLRRLAPAIGGFVAVLLAIGWVLGTVEIGRRFFAMLVVVPLWGLLQQYLLLAFAHRRLRIMLGAGRRTLVVTALLFAVMHLPNPVLVIACGLGGLVWAREYDRSPNLLAHAVTHAVGSAFLANSLPDSVLKHMVVGYRYFLL